MLYQKTPTGWEEAKGHPCSTILSKPNSYLTRFGLLHHLMIGCTLWGNGYARIHRDRLFRPVRLQLLQPYECEPILTVDDEVVYRLTNGELVPSYDIIHLKGLSTNGYKGKSPIQVHRENLALTQSAQDYGEKFFTQGGNMSGVFKYPGTLKPESYKRLKHDLVEQSVGLSNAHTPLLLEGGMTYEEILLSDYKEYEIEGGDAGSKGRTWPRHAFHDAGKPRSRRHPCSFLRRCERRHSL